MKLAAIKGACVAVVLFVVEGLALMAGFATLDEHSTAGPIEGKTYIPFPNWLYVVMPLLTGLGVFLYFWFRSVSAKGRVCTCTDHVCTSE